MHRDIKPENIFVREAGDLVLGDFGIVFFQEDGRLTTTFERVGSPFWMAPWAYDNARLELGQIKPPLDIYPLGKVLWSMIAGRNGFKFWEYDREENNLEKLFPDDPEMALINSLISKCVVREERDCLPSAEALRSAVDGAIAEIRARVAYRCEGVNSWACRVCGPGSYHEGGLRHTIKGYREGGPWELKNLALEIYICDHCGHAELFGQYPNRHPNTFP